MADVAVQVEQAIASALLRLYLAVSYLLCTTLGDRQLHKEATHNCWGSAAGFDSLHTMVLMCLNRFIDDACLQIQFKLRFLAFCPMELWFCRRHLSWHY